MIEVRELTKHYGSVVALDRVSFTVQPGVVTGFLGPNGAGKSTTMRVILGLDRPTSGEALVNGAPYADAAAPLAEIGGLLEAAAVDKNRSARNHLLALGATIGIGAARVDEVLEMVGLTDVARKAAGKFSLGMGQRLGIAAALLADPGVLILDEPVNGLDVDGIQWIRGLITGLAAEGKTILLSSHLMSEMQLVAEHLIVIGRGKILVDTPMREFIEQSSTDKVHVVSPRADELARLLAADGVTISVPGASQLDVSGLTAPAIGEAAARAGIALHELSPTRASLESAYLDLTRDSVEYVGSAG